VTPRRTVWAIALGALALRLALMFLRGDYVVYDEGYYLLLSRSLREGHGFTLNGLPHVALSPLQPLCVAALAFLGLGDLWASRLLGAVCGALLVVPVAALAGRWYGARGATFAALASALLPTLMTFLPFFPGETWNLYFGSEPLFLLLGTGAIAAAVHAVDEGSMAWWALAGAAAGLAYLARLEGVVLAATLGAVTLAALVRRRRLAFWPRAALALAAGTLVALPYLFYLHGALGRWALSGRVQAAASDEPAAPQVGAAAPAPGGGSQTVRAFVWGGDQEALWRVLYALDASGTRMASQYWGVPHRAAAGSARATLPTGAPPAAAAPAPPRAPAPSQASTLLRAAALVVPVWVLVLAALGFAAARPRAETALWLAPALLTALLPALLAYAEPRALLMLAPAACVLAGGALARAFDWSAGRRMMHWPLPLGAAALLAYPTAHDALRAGDQSTPLQQVAMARRFVGERLAAHLPPGAKIVSWHPAVALYAHRDWRVLPYDTFERIVGYARAQGARVVVFSRFDPSPLREAPRAFTAILLDSGAVFTGGTVHLEPVEQTPLLFVGRLAASP